MPDRFLNLTTGTAMVVSDLHGDRYAFDQVLTTFSRLFWRGDAQRLVLLGDLIHAYGSPDDDASLNMVLDLITLRRELGADTVIMLLGNHEMPHIYGVSLTKGDHEFTPRFEHALGQHRDRVLGFFESLPFYIRTSAGVMLSHAGPSMESILRAEALRTFDHRLILEEADYTLSQSEDLSDMYQRYRNLYGLPYQEMAFRYLAIAGPQDPRYPHLLRSFMISHQDIRFQILWDALFTQNENGISASAYLKATQQFLAAFSLGAPTDQRVIVSGHIATPGGGYRIVNRHHLRLSSAAHAVPRRSGQYLLLDCTRPVDCADQLVDGLHSLFDEA